MRHILHLSLIHIFRLEKKDNKLGVFHSYAFQDTYWEDDVLPAFINFLQEHPSETLIVSLKMEGGTLEDYASLLSASLSNPEHLDYFVSDFNPELILKECRGKILFLHRDHAMDCYPGAACIGWKDNSTCQLTLRNKDGREGYVSVSYTHLRASTSVINVLSTICSPEDIG